MSLRDALLKAGKVSKDQARKVATEERRDRGARKGHVLEAEREAEREALYQRQLAEKRAADRERDRLAAEERARHESRARAMNLIQAWQRQPARNGKVPWWFVRSNGSIGLIRVDARVAAELQFGQAGIVELPMNEQDVRVVRHEGIERLLEFWSFGVRFFVGRDAPDDPLVNPPALPPVGAPSPEPERTP